MKSLLNFIYRFHYAILFLFFEGLALVLLVQYNDYQRSSFLNSSSSLAGSVFRTSNNISQYFGLREKNLILTRELAYYRDYDKASYKYDKVKVIDIFDSIYIQKYKTIPAQVINNSINKQNNFLTINAGSRQGIAREMAVIAPDGVVGIVKDVSANYAAVISILNHNLRISAMVKRNGYYGSLLWEGDNHKEALLIDLPNHIDILPGDSIITSGYSAMFPKGEFIGIVDHVEDSRGGDFLQVVVKLAVDFKNVSNVLVIKNLLKEEQLSLEEAVGND